MGHGQFEDSATFNLVDILEYGPNMIVILNILVQDSCTIQGLAFEFGKVLSYEKCNYPRFLFIFEGKAEIVIHGNSNFLQKGDSILIPAHVPSSIEANQKFKMICTAIKSG